MKSQLVQAVIPALEASRSQFDEIAKESGVCKSTLQKIAAGSVPDPRTGNLERIYISLVKRGHLSPEFTFNIAA